MKVNSTRALVVVVTLVVLASFGFASYSVKVSLNERDQRAALAANLARENQVRIMLACERQAVLVRLLDPLLPGVELASELERVDGRYPSASTCSRRKP